mmetsp:Transcript_76394/g.224091  ORF Transcript_76394/g.224091 Transcript_76394/m.224091 type:complete len:246 (+) Transcript_76394:124-861(+)
MPRPYGTAAGHAVTAAENHVFSKTRLTTAPFGEVSSSTIASPSMYRLEVAMRLPSLRLVTMHSMSPFHCGSTNTSFPSWSKVLCTPAPTRNLMVIGSLRRFWTMKASPTWAMFCTCRPAPYWAALAASRITGPRPTSFMKLFTSPVTRVQSHAPPKSTVGVSSSPVSLPAVEDAPTRTVSAVDLSSRSSRCCSFTRSRILWFLKACDAGILMSTSTISAEDPKALDGQHAIIWVSFSSTRQHLLN